jgi:K+-transporting ATPase ATPase C chain
MKTNIFSAIKLTILTIIFFCGIYTSMVWAIAQLSPNHGKGEIITQNGKTYYANIGQSFTEDKYFNSRPSAVNYNAAGSCGSNKGPSNPDYLAQVQARIDTFIAHNPTVKKEAIPSELVTASGSGLDPNISVEAAVIQIDRISKARNISSDVLQQLIKKQTEQPLAGLFGPKKINVLKLNLALDNLKQ